MVATQPAFRHRRGVQWGAYFAPQVGLAFGRVHKHTLVIALDLAVKRTLTSM